MIGRRRDESESRLQECVIVADHRAIVVRPILANTCISYVTPSLRHGTAYSAKAVLNTIVSDCYGAKNATS